MRTDKLEKLKQQQAAIAELIRREQDKKRKEERTKDTRKKILAGAAVLDETERQNSAGDYVNAEFRKYVQELLDRFLTKDYDRAVFGLAPKPQSNGHDAGKPQRQSDEPESMTPVIELPRREKVSA